MARSMHQRAAPAIAQDIKGDHIKASHLQVWLSLCPGTAARLTPQAPRFPANVFPV